ITVRNLFYNTPARRKFLKSPNTEYAHIVDIVRRFALGFPGLQFRLYSNDSEIFSLDPSDLKKRIADVFSGHYAQKLIPVEGMDGSVALEGFVGGLDLVRKKSGEQYLFVNNRLVNDRLMNSAVYRAFSPMVEKGEYPFFVLKLTLSPQEIDVNVHPQKTEIKYRNEWQIYHFIRNAVSIALKDNLRVVPSFRRPDAVPAAPKYSGRSGVAQEIPGLFPHHSTAARPPEPAPLPEEHPLNRRIRQFNTNLAPEDASLPNGKTSVVSMWQAHNKYIFVQIASAVIIIDQHAAHERILFEKALKTFTESSVQNAQQLLFPVSLELAPDDFALLGEILDMFKKLGFSLRAFGKNTMLIEAVPADLHSIHEGRVVLDILDDYRERRSTRKDKTYNMAASYACKAAIKTGDALEPVEMQNLVDQLFQTESPYACPHGRPTIINLTLEELDKRFKRT
ncbi:MAG: DNA mismatch repair endonuclease MutL, partial [FCB group bacterium]|nr:DNA mismatch repair endonuclease MutL [FCB group bacterium]